MKVTHPTEVLCRDALMDGALLAALDFALLFSSPSISRGLAWFIFEGSAQPFSRANGTAGSSHFSDILPWILQRLFRTFSHLHANNMAPEGDEFSRGASRRCSAINEQRIANRAGPMMIVKLLDRWLTQNLACRNEQHSGGRVNATREHHTRAKF